MSEVATPNTVPTRDIALRYERENRGECPVPDCKNDRFLNLCRVHHDWMGDYLIAQIARDAGLINPHKEVPGEAERYRQYQESRATPNG